MQASKAPFYLQNISGVPQADPTEKRVFDYQCPFNEPHWLTLGANVGLLAGGGGLDGFQVCRTRPANSHDDVWLPCR